MMRTALVCLALVAINIAACAPPLSPTPTVPASGPSALSVAVASNDFGVGTPRVPFVVFSGTVPVTNATTIDLTAFDLSSGTPVPGWSGSATGYTDYDVPYWVVYPNLSHSGYWGLGAIVTFADGTTTPAQFTIEALDTSSAPNLGDRPPASDNRTLATEPEIAKLTSDAVPEPGLYELTVAEAMDSGRPTVVTFATPAFCESRLCAPVVDSVKAVQQQYPERVNFIHIEVYKSFDPFVYADEMDEWGLASEPWTFVLDDEGKVVARLGGPVSPQELSAILAPLVGE